MPVRSLHHVSFGVTDIATTRRFAEDFGLHTVESTDNLLIMRTGGGDAWCYRAQRAEQRSFLGLGFLVDSERDLENAVKDHGATQIRELETPGGGLAVTLTHPEGLKVELLYGVDGHTPVQPAPDLRINTPASRIRFTEPQSTRPLGPTQLFRLGHIGLYTKNYRASTAWFEKTLGMKTSDAMHVPHKPEAVVVGFLRVDRGEEFVDHHSLFLAQSPKTGLHHISFEAQDYEAQFVAHRWLLSKGWEPNWGIGRHPLGCHVFDVWFDPDKYRFETFSDTDLVNQDHLTGHYDISKHELDMWSDKPPDSYFD